MRPLPASVSGQNVIGRHWCGDQSTGGACCKAIRIRKRRHRRFAKLMVEYPHLQVEFVPNTGQLLFFTEWRQVLDRIDAYLSA